MGKKLRRDDPFDRTRARAGLHRESRQVPAPRQPHARAPTSLHRLPFLFARSRRQIAPDAGRQAAPAAKTLLGTKVITARGPGRFRGSRCCRPTTRSPSAARRREPATRLRGPKGCARPDDLDGRERRDRGAFVCSSPSSLRRDLHTGSLAADGRARLARARPVRATTVPRHRGQLDAGAPGGARSRSARSRKCSRRPLALDAPPESRISSPTTTSCSWGEATRRVPPDPAPRKRKAPDALPRWSPARRTAALKILTGRRLVDALPAGRASPREPTRYRSSVHGRPVGKHRGVPRQRRLLPEGRRVLHLVPRSLTPLLVGRLAAAASRARVVVSPLALAFRRDARGDGSAPAREALRRRRLLGGLCAASRSRAGSIVVTKSTTRPTAGRTRRATTPG